MHTQSLNSRSFPANQRWQAEMAQLTDVAHDYSGAASDRLALIFNAG